MAAAKPEYSVNWINVVKVSDVEEPLSSALEERRPEPNEPSKVGGAIFPKPPSLSKPPLLLDTVTSGLASSNSSLRM